MKTSVLMATASGASLVAAALMLSPAIARSGDGAPTLRGGSVSARAFGGFTPAVGDPRLAAALARRGGAREFRFTPAGTESERPRAVRVAVRARASTPAEAVRSAVEATSASAVTAITPSSYNLGASVGWRRFAVTSDVAKSEGGVLPGGRESAEVGVNYRADRRVTGRVAVAAERSEGVQRLVNADQAYSLDVGGSYSIARNVDVTGGVRYRISRDRLEPLARDERRDSQAVYIGTAFRF